LDDKENESVTKTFDLNLNIQPLLTEENSETTKTTVSVSKSEKHTDHKKKDHKTEASQTLTKIPPKNKKTPDSITPKHSEKDKKKIR